jgi:hypothetical protein
MEQSVRFILEASRGGGKKERIFRSGGACVRTQTPPGLCARRRQLGSGGACVRPFSEPQHSLPIVHMAQPSEECGMRVDCKSKSQKSTPGADLGEDGESWEVGEH